MRALLPQATSWGEHGCRQVAGVTWQMQFHSHDKVTAMIRSINHGFRV